MFKCLEKLVFLFQLWQELRLQDKLLLLRNLYRLVLGLLIWRFGIQHNLVLDSISEISQHRIASNKETVPDHIVRYLGTIDGNLGLVLCSYSCDKLARTTAQTFERFGSPGREGQKLQIDERFFLFHDPTKLTNMMYSIDFIFFLYFKMLN